jgi:hypothetical protein
MRIALTRRQWFVILPVSCLILLHPPQSIPQDQPLIMLAAVSRDNAMLTGGISEGTRTHDGQVFVEPIARVTASGAWQSLGCGHVDRKGCVVFEHRYLKKPHSYTVVSGDGYGATIHAAPVKLDECNSYTGAGTYSGEPISHSTIAAAPADSFAESPLLNPLETAASAPILKSLSTLVPARLDSTSQLQLFSLRLEGRSFVIVQRGLASHARSSLDLVFGIVETEKGQLRTLYWTGSTADDENERILGQIHLTSGRDFLITTVSDPEGQWFRVYGIRSNKLTKVFDGGGSSC